jgi:hypothetical protein
MSAYSKTVLALSALLALSGCASYVEDDPQVSAAPSALTAAGEIRVLILGNSQLGFLPTPPMVGRALQAFSVAANNGAAKMVVTLAQSPTGSCDSYLTYPDLMTQASSGNYDVVILQPPYTETAGNAACWDKYRTAAENAGAEFGMLVSHAIMAGYRTQDDVKLDTAIRNYAVDRGILYIPANRTMRLLLGANPTDDALRKWYQSDQAHPSGLGAYEYVLALYQGITWKPVMNAPYQVADLYCNKDTGACGEPYPTQAQATLMQSGVTQYVGNRLVALKANSNQNFTTAENAGNNPLVNRASVAGSWETFRVSINNDGTIALKATVNDRWVCAESAGADPLIANRTAVGPWESFTLQRTGGRFFALKAKANAKYVTFNKDGTTPLKARADTVLDWEKFSVKYL